MTPSEITLPLCPYCGPTCAIGFQFCHCGCGKKTTIMHCNYAPLGWIKGNPRRFTRGHGNKIRLPLNDDMKFKLDGIPCRLIPLTQGQWAIVWASDYEYLMQWKWSAMWSPSVRSFYAVRAGERVNGKKSPLVWMHRDLLGLKPGDKREGDHADPLRTLENTRINLRFASSSQQKQNTRLRKDNQCGLKGVCFDDRRGMWKAQICVNGVHKWLGYFRTKEEAYAAYCEAAKFYFREFARIA